jgi:hypothetical protein
MASSLQWLVIFGYKFTSFLLGLQPWWSPTIGWRAFGKSNGCDRSKMERLNNYQHSVFGDVPFPFIVVWQFDNLDNVISVRLVDV